MLSDYLKDILINKTALIMKKVLFLAALLLVCFSGVTNAQTRKQREDAKREAWKKERQEKKAFTTSLTAEEMQLIRPVH